MWRWGVTRQAFHFSTNRALQCRLHRKRCWSGLSDTCETLQRNSRGQARARGRAAQKRSQRPHQRRNRRKLSINSICFRRWKMVDYRAWHRRKRRYRSTTTFGLLAEAFSWSELLLLLRSVSHSSCFLVGRFKVSSLGGLQ